jgi:hypothetical protein
MAAMAAGSSSAGRREVPRASSSPLGALRAALMATGVAAVVADQTADPMRSPSWLRRAAGIVAVACGLGAIAAHGLMAARRER